MIKKINFDSCYYVLTNENHKEDKSKILEVLKKGNFINEDFVETDYFFTKQYKPFIINILEKPLSLFQEEMKRIIPEENNFLKIENIWSQQYNKGGEHSWHNHTGTDFFAIYYVNLQQEDTLTEFKDSNNIVHTVKAKEGDLVIFPSSIPHRSKKNIYDSVKTIIAFNITMNNS